MIIARIALGLFGLGIVVFVHELGHFIAARLAGIDVEAFSIGMGKPILKKTFRGVEYRLGMFPLGGYCKMRGHDELKGAVESGADGVKPAKGTFYGATPLQRIAVCFAGPFFNLVFAATVFSVIWGVGNEFSTQDNRIVLASRISRETYPADEAGLMTGDRIIEVNGRPTNFAHEIRENLALNPDRLLPVTVERQGQNIRLYVRPRLDRDTGAGIVGIHFWTDPVIYDVVPDSDAAIAGLMAGDRIVRMNGEDIANTVDIQAVFLQRPTHVTVDFIRGGTENRAELLVTQAGGFWLGMRWPLIRYTTPRLSPPAALARGVQETWRTLALSVHSLTLLFRGINLTTVAGPLRIIDMVGEVATTSFEHGAATGAGLGQSIAAMLHSMGFILAFISIAVAIMNLLPLPVLDGGQIALYTVELVRGKPTHPKALMVFQTVGIALLFSLMLFALFGDIMFLGGRLGGG